MSEERIECMSKSKEGRRRVSKDDVRRNARTGSRGKAWLALPEGVEQWAPEKAESYFFDILPYEVKDSNHPDVASGLKVGCLWYKRPFFVHYGIGVSNDAVVCPTSVGKRCPVCEERKRLATKMGKEADEVHALNVKRVVAFPMIHPEASDKIAIMCMSYGCFAKPLEQELAQTEEENLAFYDVTKEGKTIKVRFSQSTFDGRKFLEATRFDFRPRDPMKEDEILDRVPCLDEILNVPEYDDLRKKLFQADEEEEDKDKEGKDDKDDDEDEKPKSSKKEEDEDGDSDGVTEGDTVSFEDSKGKSRMGKVVDVDDDDITVDVDGKEFTIDVSDCTVVDKDEDEEEDEEKDKDDDEGEDEKEDEELKAGDKVTWDDGDEKGVVVKKKGDGYLVKDKDGDQVLVDADELEKVEEDEEEEGDGEDEEEDEEDEDDKDDDEPPAKKPGRRGTRK